MTTTLPPELADAHDANYADFSTGFARRSGSELTRGPTFDRAIIDLPTLFYNGIFRSRLAPDAIAGVAGETIALARARRVPVGWRVTPTTPPHTVVALEQVGWHIDHQTPVMAKALDTVAPATTRAGTTVEEVTIDGLADWSRIVAVAFGCPEEHVEGPASYDRDVGLPGETPLRRFLLRVDGEPLATSALLPGGAGTGLSGIYCVGTLARARGRGLGAVVTQAAVHAARDAGDRVVVLQATEMGRPIYERLGFDTVASISVLIPPTE